MTRAASIAWVIAGAAALFVLRFGYDFGAGDHEELLSLLLHHRDPTLFARDWYIQEQGSGFTVRTPFVWILSGLMALLPLGATVLLVHVVTWVAVAWGLYRLAEALGASPLAASAATVLTLTAVPTWTLGGNAIVAHMLAPEMMAWALALPALRLATESRMVWAGVLLGLATYLQLLVGVLVSGALGLAIVLGALQASHWERWRLALTLGGTALVVALPMVLAIASYRGAGPPPPDDGLSTFFLIAELRLPHHYLPSEFGLGRWARFGLVAALGGIGFGLRRRVAAPMRFAERFLLAIGLLCAVAALAVELASSLFIAQLQVFKLTVLANAVLVVAFCVGLASSLPDAARRWKGLGPRLSLGLAALLLVGLAGLVASGRLDSRIGPWARAHEPLTAVEAWIGENTPRDALVAVPPSNTTFRLAARRSVVATYKPAPFQDGAMHEWYARLLALAPRADAGRARGLAFGDELDTAYGNNTAADWARLSRDYGITHVVRNRTGGEAPDGLAIFEAGTWVVYEIAPSAPGREGDDASSRVGT